VPAYTVASVKISSFLAISIVRVTLVTLASGSAGCATSNSHTAENTLGYQPLNRAALRLSQPHTMVVPDLPPPAFGEEYSAIRPRGMAAAVGTALRTCSNKAEIDAMGLQDPAISIRSVIEPRLSKRFSLQSPPPAMADPDLVLEIATTLWMIEPTGIGSSGLKYEGRIKLIDRRRNVVLADGICKADSGGTAAPRSCNELVKDNGAALKENLRETADYCAEDFRTRLLGLY